MQYAYIVHIWANLDASGRTQNEYCTRCMHTAYPSNMKLWQMAMCFLLEYKYSEYCSTSYEHVTKYKSLNCSTKFNSLPSCPTHEACYLQFCRPCAGSHVVSVSVSSFNGLVVQNTDNLQFPTKTESPAYQHHCRSIHDDNNQQQQQSMSAAS